MKSKLPKHSKEFLEQQYIGEAKSIAVIAKECGTYMNAIRRELIWYGIPIRDKTEAQKVAIATGRHEHPTEGKKRDETVKAKIGQTVSKNWEALPEDVRAKRSEIAKQYWEEMPEQQKDTLYRKAAQSVRRAAEEGSSTEKFLLKGLASLGYRVEFHREGLIANNKLQIDLYLPDLKTAIEIDGPTHFLPIWGEDKLLKHKLADAEKNGLLATNGYNVIRVKILNKNISKVYQKKVLTLVLQALTEIEKNPFRSIENRIIEVSADG